MARPMTVSDQACRRLGLVLSLRQQFACRYLERRGLVFREHFGQPNCEQLAADEWIKELEHAVAYASYAETLECWKKARC